MNKVKNISKEGVMNTVQSYAGYLWLLSAGLPFLFRLPTTAVPIWALGLILGGWIANKSPLRWIALAWIISIFFPQIPFLLLAGSGVLLRDWRDGIYAAVLGSGMVLIHVPDEFINIGTVLIASGLILMIYKRLK